MTAAGSDPICFGILVAILLKMAMFTPPLGINLASFRDCVIAATSTMSSSGPWPLS